MLVRRIPLAELKNGTSLFQSHFWAEVKQETGWIPYAFSLTDVDSAIGFPNQTMLVLYRNVARLFSMAYIPYGPLAKNYLYNGGALLALSGELKRLTSKRLDLVRFDLPWRSALDSDRLPEGVSLLPYSLQPEATIQIDLNESQETLYQNLRKRAKRHINRGEQYLTTRVVAGPDASREFEQWYETYRKTAERQGFGIRNKSYLRNLLTRSGAGAAGVHASMILVYHHDQICAGMILLSSDEQTVYLFGSSMPLEIDGHQVSPAYLMQWRAIQHAKKSGCVCYDLHGIASGSSTSSHLMGLNQFKESFGGVRVERSGSVDVVLGSRLPYFAYRTAEAYRMHRARRSG